MMDWTDRHCRYLHRLLSRRALLYTEMVTTGALLHGDVPHQPTFRVFDRTYGPEPVACDFVFVSDGLKDRLRSVTVDGETKVSDHQPVAVELG